MPKLGVANHRALSTAYKHCKVLCDVQRKYANEERFRSLECGVADVIKVITHSDFEYAENEVNIQQSSMVASEQSFASFSTDNGIF